MEINYNNRKLEKSCSNSAKMVKAYGDKTAKKLQRRLMEIRASENLEVLCQLPAPRCHQLKGKRDNQFAVNLVHPFRLIFEPYQDPAPLKDDGGFDTGKIISILIIEVVDYHGE